MMLHVLAFIMVSFNYFIFLNGQDRIYPRPPLIVSVPFFDPSLLDSVPHRVYNGWKGIAELVTPIQEVCPTVLFAQWRKNVWQSLK